MSRHAQAEFLTLQQAADTLNVSAQYIRRLLDNGALEAVMVDGRERLRSADLLALKGKRDARLGPAWRS